MVTIGAASLAALEAKHGPLPPTRDGDHRRRRSAFLVSLSRADPIDRRPDRAWPRYQRRRRFHHRAAERASVRSPLRICFVRSSRRGAGMAGAARPHKAAVDFRTCARHSRQRGVRKSPPTPMAGPRSMREIASLAAALPGTRNTALNCAAFKLFQFVAGGELDDDQVVERLVDACHRNGLVKDDGLRSVLATIRSAPRRPEVSALAIGRRMTELRPYQADIIAQFRSYARKQAPHDPGRADRHRARRSSPRHHQGGGRAAARMFSCWRIGARSSTQTSDKLRAHRHRARHHPGRDFAATA